MTGDEDDYVDGSAIVTSSGRSVIRKLQERVMHLETENAALRKTLHGYRLAWFASNAYIGRMTVALEAAGLAALAVEDVANNTDMHGCGEE
jgi:hypothetical protein